MAKDLDRVNCQFYLRTGVCRRKNHCTEYHNCPTISCTLLLSNMYQRLDKITPGMDAEGNPIDANQIQEHFEDFYKDIFEMLSTYGEIMCLNVCDNLAYHMDGNVYVQFRHEKQAEAALKGLQGNLYNNEQAIRVDYSPVTNFYSATCALFEKNSCIRGFYCNFWHVKKIRRTLMRELYNRSRSRSPSIIRDRDSRKRSQERGDHRVDRDRKRHERLRYSRSRSKSRSRSPSFRRDRERSHERDDLRDRDRVRHKMRYERMSRRSRYRQSPSRSPSYRRYTRESRERSHERGDHVWEQ
ncbi:splicing factor U2af small subunit B-like [Carex rostrata]